MAEGAPLLREYGLKAHRGFESLPLRQLSSGSTHLTGDGHHQALLIIPPGRRTAHHNELTLLVGSFQSS